MHLPDEPTGFYQHTQSGDTLILLINAQPESKPKSIALTSSVLGFIQNGNTIESEGKIQLYLETNEHSADLSHGDVIVAKLRYDSIVNTSDTGFDASFYFAQKDIYHRAYIPAKDWWLNRKNDTHNRMAYFRNHAAETIKGWGMRPHSEQVMTALVLGDKRSLDKALRQQYADAGVVHVLAVSGLHVGVIYLLVSLLLNVFLQARYALAKTLIIIVILWFYAFLTGLSPSVWRAATMFTLLSVGRSLGRITGIYHTIAASALLLLILEPNLLFHPGFQLSYAAVFGIVRYQPQMQDWWTPSKSWINQIWQLVTVSLSAQMITLPFTTYYFGQFPTYFLLSNLLIIPLLSSIMIGSIVILIIGIVTPLPNWMSTTLDTVYNIQNEIVAQITSLPYAVISDLEATLLQAGLLLLIFISGLEMLRSRKATWIMIWIACCIGVVIVL